MCGRLQIINLRPKKCSGQSHYDRYGSYATEHVEYVTNKVRCHLGYIFMMFSPFCSPDSLIRLYHSHVLPLIEYGFVVWDPHFVKHKQQLGKVQLFATRIASKQWSGSANTLNSHFNFCLRRNYLKLLYLYKLLRLVLMLFWFLIQTLTFEFLMRNN